MSDQTVRGDVRAHTDTQTADRMLEIVRLVLGRPSLGHDDEVMDHGGTSLAVVRIMAEARSRWSYEVDPRDLDGVVSARSLARAVR